MKKNLGKIFLFVTLFFHPQLFATTYEWHAAIDKQKAFVNEPIYLHYTCTFSDRAELYSIEFNPSGEYEKFRVQNLKESQSIVDGKRIYSYEFIVFAKSAGEIELSFEALMKLTNEDAIVEMVIGRDNIKREEVKKTLIKQEVFRIAIEETNTPRVGDFWLETHKREASLKAHEPYHMEIKIQGKGNLELFEAFVFELEGVKVFAQEPLLRQELGKDGYSGVWSQKFAFVSEKSFTIPKREIEYFHLPTKQMQKLLFEAIDVKVEGGFVKEELLDKVEEKEFTFDPSYLYYLLTFIAGFLAGKIARKPSSKAPKETFLQKSKDANSLDALMVLLVLEDAKKYETLIEEIEQKKITSLASAKKIVAKKFYNDEKIL